VGAVVRSSSPTPLLVAGDFNEWSPAWGSRLLGARGRVLEDWARTLGLEVINQGRESTCVRPQGESIIDVTFGSLWVKNSMTSWRVLDLESLSDHLHIEMEFGSARRCIANPERGKSVGWALAKLDEEALEGALLVAAWAGGAENPGRGLQKETEWLRGTMQQVCDAAMPRAKPRPVGSHIGGPIR